MINCMMTLEQRMGPREQVEVIHSPWARPVIRVFKGLFNSAISCMMTFESGEQV